MQLGYELKTIPQDSKHPNEIQPMAKKKEKKEKRYQSPGVGQEWFDREYTAGEVYGRLWGFARRSKRLIFLGAFLATAFLIFSF